MARMADASFREAVRRLPDGMTPEQVRDAVRRRYGEVGATPGAGFNFPVGRAFAEAVGYPTGLLDELPPAAAAFTGVACPVPYAELTAGETVVDLGCGGGLDSLFAARLVAPGGRVIGIDFAPEMVERARAAVAAAGEPDVEVEVRLADAAALPLGDGRADAVLVNGIFNLNPDKEALLAEVWRVLRPGGRLVAAEIALREPLPAGEGHTLDDWFR